MAGDRLRIGDRVRFVGEPADVREEPDLGTVIANAKRRGWVVIAWQDDGAIDEATGAGWLRDLGGRQRAVRVPGGRWGRERVRRYAAALHRWFDHGCRWEVPRG